MPGVAEPAPASSGLFSRRPVGGYRAGLLHVVVKKMQHPGAAHAILGTEGQHGFLEPVPAGWGPLRAVRALFLAVCYAGLLVLVSCGGGGGGGNPGGGGDNPPSDGGGGNPPSGGGGSNPPSGGGGSDPPSGGGDGNPTPPVARAADFEADPEYCTEVGGICENWALQATGASEAYARIAQQEGSSADSLAPGEGVTIVVIDTGIDQDHWEFDGGSITETILFLGAGDEPSTGIASSHGTRVASVISAQRGRSPDNLDPQHDFHGIAWGPH